MCDNSENVPKLGRGFPIGLETKYSMIKMYRKLSENKTLLKKQKVKKISETFNRSEKSIHEIIKNGLNNCKTPKKTKNRPSKYNFCDN